MQSTCVALMVFGEEPFRRTKVEVRVGNLKNRKDAGNDEVT